MRPRTLVPVLAAAAALLVVGDVAAQRAGDPPRGARPRVQEAGRYPAQQPEPYAVQPIDRRDQLLLRQEARRNLRERARLEGAWQPGWQPGAYPGVAASAAGSPAPRGAAGWTRPGSPAAAAVPPLSADHVPFDPFDRHIPFDPFDPFGRVDATFCTALLSQPYPAYPPGYGYGYPHGALGFGYGYPPVYGSRISILAACRELDPFDLAFVSPLGGPFGVLDPAAGVPFPVYHRFHYSHGEGGRGLAPAPAAVAAGYASPYAGGYASPYAGGYGSPYAAGYGYGYPPAGPAPYYGMTDPYPAAGDPYFGATGRRGYRPTPYAGGFGGQAYGSAFDGLLPQANLAPTPGGGRGCAELFLRTSGGTEARARLALPALGAASPAELELAIDARLSRGWPVALRTADGVELRLLPGTAVEELTAESCGAGASAR